MSVRECFTGKIAAGRVSPEAGQRILDMLDDYLADRHWRQAGLDAAADASAEAARSADLAYRQTIAQANYLRNLATYDARLGRLRAEGKAPGLAGAPDLPLIRGLKGLADETASPAYATARAMLVRDPWEILSDTDSVFYLARELRGRAHGRFADAIEALRPKLLGLKSETVRELDMLRAAFGRTDVDPAARASADAWFRTEGELADDFIAAGGALAKRERYVPNPEFDAAKVRALGEARFKALVRENADRGRMLDFATGRPMTDGTFERLTDQAYRRIVGLDDAAPAAFRGRVMLANSRAAPRLFQWRDAEAWQRMADAVGAHSSIYESMLRHIHSITDDTAMLRVMGPNPEATKRFIAEVIRREPGRLAVEAESAAELKGTVQRNRRIESRARRDSKRLDDLFAELTGANRVPVQVEFGRFMGDMRAWLASAQLGSAMLSALSDAGTLLATARLSGLPVMGLIRRAVETMRVPGSELIAAQHGLIADTLAHQVGEFDRIMGETIRAGTAGKLASTVIRASGLRRWTAVLRNAFGLEWMAMAARERGRAFGELAPAMRETLQRYGIGAAEWDIVRAAEPFEARPGAPLLRFEDVHAQGPEARAAADKYARLVNEEMDHAVLEHDPLARAALIGDSRPGTARGEALRAFGLYKNFTFSFILLHGARAFARGWDGKRLSHGALTFAMMTLIGAVSMQAKQVAAGRDPYDLDPTGAHGLKAWGTAVLQGGGLGVFGDFLFVDKTRYGNSFLSTIAGPQAGAAESVLGDFLVKNVQLALQGKETHFLGDALYTAARYMPGSSLWYARLAFQRAVVDQLALMVDPRAPERFRRIEREARQNWGQEYWAPPARTIRRMPSLAPIVGGAP